MNGDRRGPEGKGPRTGRGMGYCSGANMPGRDNQGENSHPQFGQRNGLGHKNGYRGGFGNGNGQGRGFGRGQGAGRGMGQGQGRGLRRG